MANIKSIGGNPIVLGTDGLKNGAVTDAKLVQTGGVLERTNNDFLDSGKKVSVTKAPTTGVNFRTLDALNLRKGCSYDFVTSVSASASSTSWALCDADGNILKTLGTATSGTTKHSTYNATSDVSGAYVRHYGQTPNGTYTDSVQMVYDANAVKRGSAYAACATLTDGHMDVDASWFFHGSYNTTGYIADETLRICTAPLLVQSGCAVELTQGANSLYVACDVYPAKNDGTPDFSGSKTFTSGWVGSGTVSVTGGGYLIILAATAATYGASTEIVPSDFDSSLRISHPYASGELTPQNVLTQSFNAAYHQGAADFATKCTQFSALMYGDTMDDVDAPSDIESFLFFTDPHLTESNGWEDRCYEYIAQIQKYYNSTPTTFCLCGGDWLGNSDLPAEACFKMGYIDGFMHSMFDNCYMLVGNHDTNHQGKLTPESQTWTTRLSDQSIRNLWYRGGKAYYEFMGGVTRFFCFDTGVEAQALTFGDNYGWEQAKWFADSLATNTVEHVAIAAHILYYSYGDQALQPLTEQLLAIAKAFNDRGSIAVNDVEYDYANAIGKVEFGIFGHNHRDAIATVNGIPCLITTWVRDDESYGPTFDLVFVDYDSSELKTVRVGSGDDRTMAI